MNTLRPGQAVCLLPGAPGLLGQAELVRYRAEHLSAIPSGLAADAAAALSATGVPVWQMLDGVGRLRAGDAVLIIGGDKLSAGLAIQSSLLLGAGMVLTVASGDDLDVARLQGAHHVLDQAEAAWPARVQELTGGQGADLAVLLDGWADLVPAAQALDPFGRLVCTGAATPAGAMALTGIPLTNRSISSFDLQGWTAARPGEARQILERLFGYVVNGHLLVEADGRESTFRIARSAGAEASEVEKSQQRGWRYQMGLLALAFMSVTDDI